MGLFGLFLLSHGLIVLFPSPGPTDAFPSDFTSKALGVRLFVCCFVRGEGGAGGAGQAVCCLLYENNRGGKQPRPLSEGAKPPPRRRFPRPASHLAAYFQKFLCFRESFSIPPPPPSPRTSSHFAPALSKASLCPAAGAELCGAARSGAGDSAGPRGAGAATPGGPPAGPPIPAPPRHQSPLGRRTPLFPLGPKIGQKKVSCARATRRKAAPGGSYRGRGPEDVQINVYVYA